MLKSVPGDTSYSRFDHLSLVSIATKRRGQRRGTGVEWAGGGDSLCHSESSGTGEGERSLSPVLYMDHSCSIPFSFPSLPSSLLPPQCGVSPSQVGVITPYRQQQSKIRESLTCPQTTPTPHPPLITPSHPSVGTCTAFHICIDNTHF